MPTGQTLQGPIAQSLFSMHVDAQTAPSQAAYGEQLFGAPALQLPRPSHALATAMLAEHVSPHARPSAPCSQTAPAMQLPVLPQGGAAAH